jgi:ubiquinone/menaquinone biosynthesis C-methylase UbiE
VDLSAAVLAFAQREAEGHERVRFVQGDAQVYPLEPASFDAAYSRFGVMYFTDPIAAFVNVRRSLLPSGRSGKSPRVKLTLAPLDSGNSSA